MAEDGLPTVAELVAVEALGLGELLPGAGAPVRWAHATELLDPAPYLRGGELVCTVGQALTDDAACAAFAGALRAAGAVGVCFGTGDVHEQVPPALAAACREHGLALVVAGRGTPFMALTEHLAQRRVAHAVAEERAGQLLDLLAERAVAPTALLPALVDAGLGRTHLRVSAWPPGCAGALAGALAGSPHLVGAGVAVTHLVTPADAPLAAVAGRLEVPFGSGPAVPWRELGTAVRGARAALRDAPPGAAAGGPGTAPGDPATLAGVLAELPPDRLAPLVDRLVAPLQAADRRRDGGLLTTLRAYLAHDGSLVEVAREEYLHVNSVRLRLARVRELTGTDPTTLAGAADFAAALWALDRLGAFEPPGSNRGPR